MISALILSLYHLLWIKQFSDQEPRKKKLKSRKERNKRRAKAMKVKDVLLADIATRSEVRSIILCNEVCVCLWSNISNTKTVFDYTSKHREESWKYDVQRSIFDGLRGVLIAEETWSWVNDISSQSKLKLRRKKRNIIVEVYVNWDQIFRNRHSRDLFKLDESLIILRTVLRLWKNATVIEKRQYIAFISQLFNIT